MSLLIQDIKDIKKGDYFSESEYGITLWFRALEDARHVRRESGGHVWTGWTVDAESVRFEVKKPCTFFASDDYPAYAPSLERGGRPRE